MISHGRLSLKLGKYHLTTAPHVRMVVKRVLLGCAVKDNTITVAKTPDTTEALLWILSRWHHDLAPGLVEVMRYQVAANNESREHAAAILAGTAPATTPAKWTDDPAFSLREYQKQAIALARIKGGLLVGDDIGLGKTATGIGIIADVGGRWLVACETHLQRQWRAQVEMFCPTLRTHILKQTAPYPMPNHDVLITSYYKLAAANGTGNFEGVIFDECQALRGANTDRYREAQALTFGAAYRIGLSATPTYNNAGEIFNIMECIAPGTCGSAEEFKQEWGSDESNKHKVSDPIALGEWLRAQAVFIRRTRKDVGRELPPILKVSHLLGHDPKIIARLRGQANELAIKVLNAGFHEAGKSARQLDLLLRQTTGIAKACQVADFVAQLVELGEPVVLTGWHREVYEIWKREFKTKEIPCAMFTGSESGAAKAAARAAFIKGDVKVLILSNRSGAGLDGLQHVCRNIVIGELDWSPKVIEQAIGRIHRDGQAGECTAFTLYTDAGADPVMAAVLGGKWEQSTSLTDPDKVNAEATPIPESKIASLARDWLDQQKRHAL